MLPRIVAACSLVLLLVSVAVEGPARDRTPHAIGRWWLAQPVVLRQAFTRGWTDGYVTGWLSAQARLIALIEEAREADPPERELAAALVLTLAVLQEADPVYRRSPADYADQVTTFYTRYPDLRDHPVALVLKGLDGRGSMTLEGIARWLRDVRVR